MAEWLTNGIEYLWNAFSGLFSNLIIAVIIILIGFVVGRIIGKLIHKILHEVELDRVLKKSANVKFSVEKGISKFLAYFIYFIAIIVALNQLGLTTTVLHMIAAAVLIVVVLSIVLGVKDFIPNLIAGIHIQRKNLIKEGEWIRVRETEGRVIELELTETKIETKKGDHIFFPNSLLIKEQITKLKKK